MVSVATALGIDSTLEAVFHLDVNSGLRRGADGGPWETWSWRTKDPREVGYALVAVALHEDERAWAEDYVAAALGHPSPWVREWRPPAWVTSQGFTANWIPLASSRS